MKIIPCIQGSDEWLAARLGIVTASEASSLLTPKFKIKEGAGVETYLYEKIAEWWTGEPLPSFNSFALEQGQVIEDDARNWLSNELGEEVRRVGFCQTEDGKCGCSPDGLCEKSGWEIKCPQPTNAARWLLDGGIPDEHIVQVHFSLFVSGFSEWGFLSYRSRFPKHMFMAKRDQKIQDQIELAVEGFLDRFEQAKKRMIEINGGPPKPRPAPQYSKDAVQDMWNKAGAPAATDASNDAQIFPE